MPKKPTSKTSLPETWKPASGWLRETAFGFAGGLGADGQSVDLVRLSDLIRWWQRTNSVPRSEALKAVIEALPSDVMDWLYKMTMGRRAVLVDAKATFENAKSKTMPNTSQGQRNSSFSATSWGSGAATFLGVPLPITNGKIGNVPAKVVPEEQGRPALLQYLGKWVSVQPFRVVAGATQDTLDSPKDLLTYLAIPHAKAYELFGWGELGPVDATSSSTELPKTWADLKRYRKANAGHAWTQGMREILKTEEARRKQAGGTGIRKSMAEELGNMTPSGLGQQIRMPSSGTKSGRGRKTA